MKQSEFKAYSESIRANGIFHALKWITSGIHRLSMVEYYKQLKTEDNLKERVKMQTTESKRISFLLTH